MSLSVTESASSSGFTKLELRTAYGPVYREVSKAPPRNCRSDEIPIIDLSLMFGDLDARITLAATIVEAAENTGFFYIKNHGISEDLISATYRQAQAFFKQPESHKESVSKERSQYFNGWHKRQNTRSSPSESPDTMEQFSWRYDPKYDPETKDSNCIPENVKSGLQYEDFIWEGTEQIPNFKEQCIQYWQENLILARRLIKLFALGLGLPENYFDSVTTYPGSDSAVNYYAGLTEAEVASANDDVGLGSHTDLQCFTILWQDTVGGLQVLTKSGQWVKAPPIPGTFVVNIGDFFMRLTNDRFKSTVHRVYNKTTSDRYSMPFFFGFNLNETCSVLPNCVGPDNPAKYEPISCGEWIRKRFQQIEDSKGPVKSAVS